MSPLLAAVSLLGMAAAQQAGTEKPEVHPAFPISRCTVRAGCTDEETEITSDAMWRWLHDASPGGYKNCYSGTQWDPKYCPDPKACTANCAIDGMNVEGYQHLCGVNPIDRGVMLKFKTPTGSIGSRVYIIEKSNTYKVFKLKNREISFDVDVSTLPCGTNGALYLVEMKGDGGYGVGNNKAGAKYGTGYCDAQCPKDIKVIDGEANLVDWSGWAGRYGSCCSELDLFEANKAVNAFTAHPCSVEGPHRCEGQECGEAGKGDRYSGVCDMDGCDFNTYRMGNQSFYGAGPGFAVDTTKPITVVTQFITTDGTDTGDLSEIRRLYVQDGKVILNPHATVLDASSAVEADDGNSTNETGGDNSTRRLTENETGNATDGAADAASPEFTSMTDAYCKKEKQAFSALHDVDRFSAIGGLKQMGEALDRGMVLAMSMNSADQWLDSADPPTAKVTPGVVRGPCPKEKGERDGIRAKHGDAFVKFLNVKHGEIGSTLDTAGYCCFPKSTAGDICGTCASTRAKPGNFCAKSGEHCRSCKGAVWCPNYAAPAADKAGAKTAVFKKYSDSADALRTQDPGAARSSWSRDLVGVMASAVVVQVAAAAVFVLRRRACTRHTGRQRACASADCQLPMAAYGGLPAAQTHPDSPTQLDTSAEA